ncbi:MAG: hypothetical protein ACM3S3_10575, partial [Candidatus Doudnabacteria bacterium]
MHVDETVLAPLRERYGEPVRLEWEGEISEREHSLATYNPNRAHDVTLFIFNGERLGVHGLHKWWYACLARAGVVATGQTRGERMHKACHTAGQRVLDATQCNLKAVQKLLATRRSRRPETSTPTGTSTSWRRRCAGCSRRANRESFPPSLRDSAQRSGRCA